MRLILKCRFRIDIFLIILKELTNTNNFIAPWFFKATAFLKQYMNYQILAQYKLVLSKISSLRETKKT